MLHYLPVLMVSVLTGLITTIVSKFVQKGQGDQGVNLSTSLFVIIECGIIGSLFLFVFQGGAFFRIEPYSFWMGTLASLLVNIATPLSFRIMQIASISAYKLFTTTGCFLLPYLFGLFVLREDCSVWGIMGLFLLTAALVFPAISRDEREGLIVDKERRREFYLLCALSCITTSASTVVTKIYYLDTLHPKNNTIQFSFICYIMGAVAAGLIILYLRIKKKQKIEFSHSKRGWIYPIVFAINAVFSSFAYYLNMTCVEALPATVMSLLSTGLTLVLSTLMASVVFKEKMTLKVIISIIISVIAMALIYI